MKGFSNIRTLVHKTITLAIVCLLLVTAAMPALAQDDGLRVVTTIFPPYDFVRQIAGDHATVRMLLQPGAESHSFEPSPQDIIAIEQCDVFIHAGGVGDAWVERILGSMDTSGITVLTMTDMVQTVDEQLVEGMQSSHGHEEEAHDHTEEPHEHDEESEHDHDTEEPHAHAHLDEHVWTAPQNAIQIVRQIAETLARLDPAGAQAYEANTQSYIAELEALDGAFAQAVAGAARDTVLFGDRFPFRYLMDAYGLTYYAAFTGCSTSTDASAGTIAFLIDKVITEDLPVVFKIELSNGLVAQTIAESTGAKVLELNSAHNLPKADFDAGKTYLDVMWENVGALEEALR